MSLEKGTIMFHPGDIQYAQAFAGLIREGLDPGKYEYLVSVEKGPRYKHRFRSKDTRKAVEIEV